MKIFFNASRLLLETLLVVAVAELCVMLVLPVIAPNLDPFHEGLLDISLLLMFAGPTLYWRFQHAIKTASQTSPASPGDRGFANSAVLLTAAAQISGLLLTAAGMWWQSQELSHLGQTRFEEGSTRIAAEIARRLNQTAYGLKGARGAMAASSGFRRAQFRAYVAARDLPNEFPGIRGFGFVQRVQRQDIARFVAAERSDGAPDFSLRTSGNADDLYVVKYVEPLALNRLSLGFDMGQDATHREAAEYAVSTGEATLLAGVHLLQDSKNSSAFILFLPVYRSAGQPQTAQERRRELVGLLYAPIVASELLDSVSGLTDKLIDFELFDGTQAHADKLIFDADSVLSTDKPRAYTSESTLNIGSRVLTLRTSSSPRFEASLDRSSLALIGVGGTLVSFLLAIAVWLLAAGRQRAQDLANSMTAELDRMAQVVQHTDNAVTIMDRAMRIVWVNQGFVHITGYSPEEAQGKTPGELLSSGKSDAQALAALVDGGQRGVACRVELLNRAKGGREYWANTEVQPTYNAAGELLGFMEIGTDVTVQKQTQQQLETAMRDASALLNTVQLHAIVSVTDPEGFITEVNEAFCKISGYSRDELIGRNHRVVKSGTQGDAFWPAIWACISSGKPWHGEVCNRAKNGTLYWVASTIAPFVSESGVIEKYISIRTDITERKQYEQTLQEAREKAEHATRSKGQFLANMSHEIRTPMNAILGMLTLLHTTDLDRRQRDYAEKAEGAAQSLLVLINDILDFSKVDAGKMELDAQPFRLDRLMRNLSVILASNVGSKGIEVLFDMDPAIPEVLLGDSMRLQQVLINLGGNAVKFTSQGQVVIAVQLLQQDGDVARIEFAVQDSGIGIAPENHARIFTGFSQAEASTTRKFGGTGLGLAISQRLVALMGGELRLRSALGSGSTFSFALDLPMVQQIPPNLAEPSRSITPNQRVLLVEHNPVARRLLGRMVQSWGWQLESVDSGEAALALLSARTQPGAFPFDVVYMDWQMAGMDGWETTSRLRQLCSSNHAKQAVVVMLSSNTREALSQRTQQEQSLLNGFLVKPVSSSMLLDAALQADSDAKLRQADRPQASSQRRLRGMRILVVEDNLINQQVAEELLSLEGALVSLAANGQLGVDAIAAASQSKPFDAVLMDIQMPVLDGYGATALVRNELKLHSLPIIAMTANALDSDRAECLAAGMNAHVGKPFDLTQLVNTLLQISGYAPPAQTEPPARAPVRTAAPMDAGTSGVDVAAALQRLGGLRTLYANAARDFLRALPEETQALAARARSEPRAAEMLAHSLKGTAALVGADALSTLAARLEKLCHASTHGPALEVALLQLKHLAHSTQEQLSQLLSTFDETSQ
jgi:PAS domain S-box-containing protein